VLLDGGPEFFDGKVRRLAQFDERLLLGGDSRRHRRDLGGNVLRDGLDAVLITVQQSSDWIFSPPISTGVPNSTM